MEIGAASKGQPLLVKSSRSLSTVTKPKLPSLALELTAVCNQQCDYCYNEWRENNGKTVGHAETETLLRRATRLVTTFDIDHVTLTGGEPLSHPAFFDVARRFQDAGVGVQVISNGTLITEAKARALADLKLRFIQVTLNGPDESLHAAHVGPGHFERTVQGVRTLRGAGVPVVGCIVVTKKNAAVVGEIMQLWASLGVAAVALSRFSPAGYATRHVAQLLPSVSDLEVAFTQAHPFGKRITLHCTMPVPPCALDTSVFPDIRFGSCPVGTALQEFAVGPDGKLRHCTLHGYGIGGEVDIADDAVDLQALMRAPEVTTYKRQHPDFCTGCVHLESCGGGCGAASVWALGSRREVDPLVAQHTHDEFASNLAFSRRHGRTHLELIA